MNPEKKFDRAFLVEIIHRGVLIKLKDKYYQMRFERDSNYCDGCCLGKICQESGLMGFCMTISACAFREMGLNDVRFIECEPYNSQVHRSIVVDLDN